jgi:hypothetical protein
MFDFILRPGIVIMFHTTKAIALWSAARFDLRHTLRKRPTDYAVQNSRQRAEMLQTQRRRIPALEQTFAQRIDRTQYKTDVSGGVTGSERSVSTYHYLIIVLSQISYSGFLDVYGSETLTSTAWTNLHNQNRYRVPEVCILAIGNFITVYEHVD